MLTTDEEQNLLREPDYSYNGLYTYADYLKWTIEDRVELIKGKVFKMSPAPNRMHQNLTGKIYTPLSNFLSKKKCEVYFAPFDVRLPRKSKNDKDIITVVQPDVCVICDPSKLDDKGCIGAPDTVVEVLSPGNNRKELRNKYEVYEEAGVKEYWIVSPQQETLLIYRLENGKYTASRPLTTGDIATSYVLPGFELNLDDVFAGFSY